MKDDPELQKGDVRWEKEDSYLPEGDVGWRKEDTYIPDRIQTGSDKSKYLLILSGVIIIVLFIGGIKVSSMRLQVTALEEKITGLEKQLVKIAQKIEAIEKQKQPTDESIEKPSYATKPKVSTKNQYHTVRKGETLSWISRKYGISVQELRERNNLSADQPIRTGQKLLVSTGR